VALKITFPQADFTAGFKIKDSHKGKAVTTQVIKLFASIRKGIFFSSFEGKRSKTISF